MSADDRDDGSGCDLIAIAVNSLWGPHLEIAAEICLREAESGRRVAFVYLDIVNPDEYVAGTTAPGLWELGYAATRWIRMARVRTIEGILRDHGVTVIPAMSSQSVLTADQARVDAIESLQDFRLGGARLGMGVASSLISRLVDSVPDFESNRALIDRYLTAALQAFELTDDVILRYKPSRVLVFNGRFACVKAISEAVRLAGVDIWYHEATSTLDRFYLSSRPPHDVSNARAELLAAWESAGADRETVAESFFSSMRHEMDLRENSFRDRQIAGHCPPATGRHRIVYFVSSIDEYAAVENAYENPLFESQHAAVAWLTDWARQRADVELIIRVHPRMRRLSDREVGWWKSLSSGNVTTLLADDPVDSYALARSADHVVCYHSTMGVEATYMGKASILVGDGQYRGLDCVYEPASVQELEAMLTDYSLGPKPSVNCLPFGYQRLMRGHPFRFYQARSRDRGSFFGVEVTPSRAQVPLRNRVVMRALHKLNELAQLAGYAPKAPRQ